MAHYTRSLGGLMILGVGVGLMIGGADDDEVSAIVLGTIVIGFIPAAIGAGMFLWGVVRLNRAESPASRPVGPV